MKGNFLCLYFLFFGIYSPLNNIWKIGKCHNNKKNIGVQLLTIIIKPDVWYGDPNIAMDRKYPIAIYKKIKDIIIITNHTNDGICWDTSSIALSLSLVSSCLFFNSGILNKAAWIQAVVNTERKRKRSELRDTTQSYPSFPNTKVSETRSIIEYVFHL